MVTAALIFISLEVLASFFSYPAITENEEVRPCISLQPGGEQTGFTNMSSLSSIILLECMEVNNSIVHQSAGDLFRVNGELVAQCSYPLYSFSVNMGRTKIPIPPEQSSVTKCETSGMYRACIVLYQNESTVSFTTLIKVEELALVIERKIPLDTWHTQVNFSIEGLESNFASRAIRMLRSASPNPVSLRREVFTVDGVGACKFRKLADATSVRFDIIYILVIISMGSLLAAISSCFFFSDLEFDISNPLHWADRTLVSEHSMGAADPEISYSDSCSSQFGVSSSRRSNPNDLRRIFPNIFMRTAPVDV